MKRGKVVDDRSMAWGCEELFGVIGVIWVRFLSGLATVASCDCEDVVESEKCTKRRVERVGPVTRLFATRPN